MPIKWTPENDQLLLLKILETHELTVDTKKVSDAWPAKEDNQKPTPRAISERIVKIRGIIKATGAAPLTKVAANKGQATSRKRGAPNTPNSKRVRVKADPEPVATKSEASDSDQEESRAVMGIAANRTSEQRRVRKPRALSFGYVTYNDINTDYENKYESTDSEYAPKAGNEAVVGGGEDEGI